MNELINLRDFDLAAIRVALLQGRVKAPYTQAALAGLCSKETVANVSHTLNELAANGYSERMFVSLIDLLLADRAARKQGVDDAIDLVWTGPETESLANRDTATVVRDLFGSATNHVLLSGYAVYQGKTIFAPLAEKLETDPAFSVRMYLDVKRQDGDGASDEEVVREFVRRFVRDQWPGKRLPDVYFDPRSLSKRSSLHSKCVVIDRSIAFVSSANFTEAAQERNVELGVLIRSAHFSDRIITHYEKLREAKLFEPLPLHLGI